MLVKSLNAGPAGQIGAVTPIVIAGLLLMAVARWGSRSPFFQTRRESYRHYGHGKGRS